MLHVLLLILKIIGITLLVMLGLILLIILLILFVPVRYSGDTRFKRLDEEAVTETVSPQKITVSTGNIELYALAKVTWLLHFISFVFNYSDGIGYRLKILGITFMSEGNLKKEKKLKKKDKKKTDGEEESEKIKAEETKAEETKAEETKAEETKTEEAKAEEAKAEEIKTEEEKAKEEKPEEAKSEQAKTEEGKKEEIKPEEAGTDTEISSEAKKEESEEGEEQAPKQSVVEKIKNIYNKTTALLDDKKIQKAYELVKAQLVRLLKAVAPRKLGGYAKYGFEDPSITGYITAFLAAEYGRVNKLDIEPYFDEEILEGELTFKGRIFMITIVCIACKVYFNKYFKYGMKKLKEYKEDITG
ncbi:MAG: DUF2953 domain-containing protein [Lachnospiraceae bacterium]|nr:DUF2953 domain-containing protein [Lachnospiraceae bacterium]